MSSLGDLHDAIVAEFDADQQSTSIVFGAREVSRQINQGMPVSNRIVIEPIVGDMIGPILPPRTPGGNPRNVARLDVSATIYCWAYDGSTPAAASSERAQYEAVLALFVRAVRAIVNAREGEISLGTVRKVKPEKRELVLGQEWAFDLTVIEDCIAVAQTEVTRPDPQMTVTFDLPAPTG